MLTTDGILERRRAGGDFGRAGVEKAVGDRDGSAAEILERVFDAAAAFGDGGPWEDDATIVVVKRTAAG